MNAKILVIGDSNSGKTHLAVQLYGRVFKAHAPTWKPDSTPTDLSIFQEGFERLSSGLAIGHTSHSFNKSITLRLKNESGDVIEFDYPDYAGEQVKKLVEERKINQIWKGHVEKSTSWLLLLRPAEMTPIEDLVTRGFPSFDQLVKSRNEMAQEEFKLSGAAFYVELLQMLVHIKGLSAKNPIKGPKLVIALSCWDELPEEEKRISPPELLKEKMPIVFQFLKAHWETEAHRIIGLSSTERKLSNDQPDEDYLDQGPENFGYIISPNGEKSKDLTEIFTLMR